MIPLRDNVPSPRFPVVTVALIALNTLVFFHEQALGRGVERFFYHFGIVPALYTDAELRSWAPGDSGIAFWRTSAASPSALC